MSGAGHVIDDLIDSHPIRSKRKLRSVSGLLDVELPNGDAPILIAAQKQQAPNYIHFRFEAAQTVGKHERRSRSIFASRNVNPLSSPRSL